MGRWMLLAVLVIGITSTRTIAQDSTARGVVVDQTGLPLPGAVVTLSNGTTIVATVTTAADGSFETAIAGPVTSVAVSLDGFETITVAAVRMSRIELPLARVTDSTTVTAQTFAAPAPTTALL